MRYIYLAPLVFLASIASAQNFDNIKAVAQDDKVLIFYDIVSSNTDQSYAVQIYGSHDNYTSPIKFVTGDVGNNVKGGTNKKIEWSAEAELKSYKGDITFELRGLPSVMKLSFKNPTAGKSVKKGKSTQIQWQGGSASNQVRINLYQGEKMVAPVTEGNNNNGVYAWAVPKDLDSGSDYYLKLTSGNESITSDQFRIKSKMPLLLKLSPILLVGAVVPFLGGGGDPGPGTTDADLPTPPTP